MLNKIFSYVLTFILLITAILPAFTASASADSETVKLTKKPGTYNSYISDIGADVSVRPLDTINIDATQFAEDSGLSVVDKEGISAVAMEELGDTLKMTVDIKTAGFYKIGLNYYALPSNGSDIELALNIDGNAYFSGMEKLTFARLFSITKEDFNKDNRGNELRPAQEEKFSWQFTDIIDSEGVVDDAYAFYFTEGQHNISFSLEREKVAISSVLVYNEENIASYSEPTDANKVSAKPIILEAEHPDYTSSTTLYPLSDMSDPNTTPYDTSLVRLNTIGGDSWIYPSQKLTYSFEVEEAGYYSLGLRYLQNWQSGMNTYRYIKIDGKLPFAEMSSQPFPYTVSWERTVVGEDEPYYIYLSEGSHTIEIGVTTGEVSDILSDVDDSVYALNEIYRKIITITGISPDIYRDYNLENMIPNLLDNFKFISDSLKASEDAFYKMTGKKGGKTATLQQIYYQLDDFIKSPNTIASRISTFKTNISSLSTWVMDMREQPLKLDKIFFTGYGQEIPTDEYGFFACLWCSIQSFFLSFTTDYSSVGNVYDENESITVWSSSGRDQAEILKEMIDSQFTTEAGIGVNFSIVSGSLMQAVMAGKGPDVVCSVGRGEPINMALRGAILPIDTFDDFNEVTDTYGESDLVPYYFNGNCYALPTTRNMYMMFYRTDIFEEFNIEAPNTWEELLVVAETLHRNNMNVGLPYSNMDAYDVVGSGIGASSIFPTLLIQNGVKIYNEDLTGTNFSSETGYKTFKTWTEFYTLYGFDLVKNDFNRFRTGEMPIVIQNYTFYNQLYAAAPEIRNMWKMTAIPGVIQEDGSINRTQVTSGSASVMTRDTKNKDSAWEFMKWWTDAQTQGTFGKRIESRLGAAARYSPIKKAAVSMIPWSGSELSLIQSRFDDVSEIEEIPGGYYTSRNLENALKEVVYNNKNPRETLNYWNDKTNAEILRKRQEFGLD